MEFDSRRRASLDGVWDFFPGDHTLDDLDGLVAETIRVPGVWEAQGWLDLDGPAWYRRRFSLEEISGHWTLCFAAVMDRADVYLNGVALGSHEQPFTPFELDPAPALRAGENDLAVRVVDPSLHDPDHVRMAHGKQGWANHVFPSRPSLYLTYGGIWQGVSLRRHGPVVVSDVFVNGDPDDLVVAVEAENRSDSVQTVQVGVRTLGTVGEVRADVPPGVTRRLDVRFGPTTVARWSPEHPNLQEATVDLHADGQPSDFHEVRYGLRTVRMEGKRMLVNGEPYRMKSALVQGFRSDGLYAEGTRAQIVEEVAAAKAMGFNTLRLHIKAFDPTYLDVCDEMGMLLHCDIPVAEPLAHDEMGGDTLLTRRCLTAAREQVRRDRNHPSVILWSAMNEVCDGQWEARQWPGYEQFARALYGAVSEEDPTRPVIENDWIEPDPEYVFVSPILTAHWYGRLHRDYLDKIENASKRWADEDRPLFVTEYGDWGLPDMPLVPDPPFWDSREVYASGLAGTLWPGSIARFIIETQRYQGVSDRLQTEVFRRHEHIGGYCLTELTDVPQELNGVLDLFRRPKRIAVAEVTRSNQVVLPMLDLDSLVVSAGGILQAPLHVANDGPPLAEVVLEARFGETAPMTAADELLRLDSRDLPLRTVEERFRETVSVTRLGDVPGWAATSYPPIDVATPDVPGTHDLVLRLRSEGGQVTENRYPIHVVAPVRRPVRARVLGSRRATAGLVTAGMDIHTDDVHADNGGDRGPTVVAEDALDAATGAEVRARLDRGEVVLILAQPMEAAPHYPVPVELEALTSVWGSTVFRFTTDHGAVPSLPRRAVLVAEDSTVQSASVVSRIENRPFPDTPVVIAYKPVPGAMTGTVLGSHAVGGGRLVLCQYRLSERAASGDAAACALLGDILRWAAEPRPGMRREALAKDDGRALLAYSWRQEVGR
ncbi:MAG TPA: glycoside hydrolase family 2 TIM barrel-domain containing protein [Acidimicrobiales bacterium]|nr:glycoside hydrolase family 2 TIM barrel-domain containing protein [Acidimicrobiales bacterium]